MIQQLISTSSPRCLNGNAGFGIVAQTAGMAPNVSQAVNSLSGYSHRFAAGDVRNPAAFLHTLRRTGGVLRHIVSRTADAGNDYSGRTNRLAHHWIIEENDVRQLPCGPAALASQNIFTTAWSGQSRELPQQNLSNVPVSAQKCLTWEQLTGDAGWAGAVAERIEKGNSVSIIFTVNQSSASGDVRLRLLNEIFAMLPEQIRWQTTFSTFFMKSQEPAGAGREERVQVKFFLEGTDEARYAKQSPETLLIDLRSPAAAGTCPAGKYIDAARGIIKTRDKHEPVAVRSNQAAASPEEPDLLIPSETDSSAEDYQVYEVDGTNLTLGVPKISRGLTPAEQAKMRKPKRENINPLYWLVPVVLLLIVLISTTLYLFTGNAVEIVKKQKEEPQSKAESEGQKAESTQTAKEKAEVSPSNGAADTKNTDNKKDNPRTDNQPPQTSENKGADSSKTSGTKSEEPKTAPNEQEIEQLNKTIDVAKKYLVDTIEAEKIVEDKNASKDTITQKITELNGKIQHEKIKSALSKLPDVWENLALPLNNSNNAKPLPLDIFFGIEGVQSSDITLGHIPFVNLEKTKDSSDKNTTPITKKMNEKGGIEFTCKFNGNKDVLVATIEKKDKETVFQWGKDILEGNGMEGDKGFGKIAGWQKVLNRILLGKLKITVQGQPKEILLWTPMVWDSSAEKKETGFTDFPGGDKLFPLCYKKDKNSGGNSCQFIGYGEENPPFLLDFDKFSVKEGGKDTVKEVKSKELQRYPAATPKDGITTYAPKIKLMDADASNIEVQSSFVSDNGMKCKIEITNKSIKEKEDVKKGKDEEKNKEICKKNDADKKISKLEKSIGSDPVIARLNQQPPHGGQVPQKWTDYQNKKGELEKEKERLKKSEENIISLEDDIKRLEREIKIIKEQLSGIAIPQFKIYLLKSGTKLEGALTSENQLLLLEVR